MDSLYKGYNKLASGKVSIKDYFNEYSEAITSANCYVPANKENENIIEMMGVNLGQEEISLLTDYCSIDNLTVEGEQQTVANTRKFRRKDVFDPEEPQDVNLQTLQVLRKRIKEKARRPECKYQSELFIDYKDMPATDGPFAIPGKDILISVRVYYPFRRLPKYSAPTHCGNKMLLNNVIGVLGSQTLSDLRDKISCVNDLSISNECSNNPDNGIGPMAKTIYTSGFFFIEDTFYNDARLPTNIDYSTTIIDWVKRRPQFGPFKTDIMENTRLDSLSLRFGFPWVYKHQGSCEHVIIFSDARFINCDDNLSVPNYPLIMRVKPKSSKLCMICSRFSVKWVTMDHERIPHNPCFFCDNCFKSYNYVNGKKVGNFRAFAYPRNTELEESITPN